MSRWITDYNPEDEKFWNSRGKRIALRNLVWSILAENLGFSVWQMWSITAARLPKVGFKYTTDQLFYLVAIPGLLGALIRFPYTFAVPKFGGRNWTVVSASLLLIPTALLAYFVQQPDTPFWEMALAAATAGFGGGNFASSMTNISFFYPDREKGFALGLNAAGGNIGVATVQLVGPLVITIGATGAVGAAGGLHLQNIAYLWMPLVLVAIVGAATSMDNLTCARSNPRAQLAVGKKKHTWVVSWLYIGTFGSFVGYAAAFPILLATKFPGVGWNVAFLGPLVGSMARPIGGKLADRVGGARVTALTFVVMAAATAGVLVALEHKDFTVFLGSFLLLFLTSGVGNGSTFRMVPAIFRAEALREVEGEGEGPAAREQAVVRAKRDAAAVVGFSSAIGALGAFFIPKAFGAIGVSTALYCFLAFYASCVLVTWWHYLRTSLFASSAPSLASANV